MAILVAALLLVGLVLAIVTLVQSRGAGLLAWAVTAIAAALTLVYVLHL